MTHVVLLGDSILDNAPYTDGGPDVVSNLTDLLSPQGKATLLAQDGALINEVHHQLQGIPSSASHLVISMGGNDALNVLPLLNESAPTVADGLARFAPYLAQFDTDYLRVLRSALSHDLPTTLCTIYNGNFPAGVERDATIIAVRLFNDSIARHAAAAGIPILELRSVCTEPDDYWNPIEPSAQGGAKIAAAIASFVN